MIKNYSVKSFDFSINQSLYECEKELAKLKKFTRGYIRGMYNRDLPIYRVSRDKRRKIFKRIADLENFIKIAKEFKAQQCRDLVLVNENKKMEVQND